MNTIASLRRSLVVIVGLGALFADTSCTQAQRARRAMATADQDYTAGRYERAEIEYKNALQLAPLNPHAITRIGTIYRIEGRTPLALTLLSKAKELKPDDSDVRLNLGLAYFAAGAAALARPEALFVVEHRPDDTEAPLLLVETSATPAEREAARQLLLKLQPKNRSAVLAALGQVALRSGQPDEGRRLFEQALAADPKSANAAAALGMMAWAARDFAQADRWLKQAADVSPIRSPRRVQYAEFKVQTGDRDSGRQLLAALTTQAPDFLPAWTARIQLAGSEKKYDEALAMSREALGRDSTDIELLLLQARIRLAKGDTDLAIPELERIVALYPGSPAGAYLLGNAYMAKGDVAKATEAMGRAVALVPDYMPAVVSLAGLNIRRGSYTAAITTLKPLAAKHPEDIRLALLLAEAYRGLGDLDNALAMYSAAQASAPTNAQIPFLRGQVLRQAGRPEEARAAYEQSLKLSPSAVPPVLQLAEIDLAAKAYDRARQRVELALVRSPKSTELYLTLATIAMAQSNLDDAKIALERAIAQAPAAPAPYLTLAQVYVTNHEEDKALAQLRKVTAADPKNIQALTITGVLYETTGKVAEARAAYEQVLTLQPDSPVALNNLACLLAESPADIGRAYELAQQARKLLPDDARTGETLGWVLYRRGDFPQAAALLRDNAPKLPAVADAQYHLGMACYMAGDLAGARTALETALKLDPKFSRAEVAREKLAVLAIDPAALSPEQRATLERMAARSPADPVALTDLSRVYERDRNLAKAETVARQAVAATPKNPLTLIQLARVLAAKGDRSHALEQARDAHALAPNNAEITHILGRIAFDDRQYRWAASLLEQAARDQPASPELQLDWARAAYSVGRVTEAQAAALRARDAAGQTSLATEASRFSELLTISTNPESVNDAATAIDTLLKQEPRNVPALIASARLADRRKDAIAARRAYEQALEQYPDFGPAQKALATFYAAAPKPPANAVEVGTKARETYPADPEVARALGILCYKAGDYRRSASLLEESAATVQRDPSLLFYLGMSQYQLKRTTDAKRTLQRALDAGLEKDLANDARRVTASLN